MCPWLIFYMHLCVLTIPAFVYFLNLFSYLFYCIMYLWRPPQSLFGGVRLKICKYSQFSLFAAFTFYKVGVNTDLQILNHRSWRNPGGGSCELLVTVYSSAHQYIILFYVYFCVKTPYLICIVVSLILKLWPTAP